MDAKEIFSQIVKELNSPEIREKSGNINQMSKESATVKVVEVINDCIDSNNYKFCLKDGVIYCFNGIYWIKVSEDEMKLFVNAAVNALGGNDTGRKHHRWKDDVYRQFMSEALFIPKEKTDGQTARQGLPSGIVRVYGLYLLQRLET